MTAMGSPVPYLAAALTLLLASLGVGAGMALVFDAPWITCASFSIGVFALLFVVRYYKGCEKDARDNWRVAVYCLWFVEIGIIFGGMLGAMLGYLIGNEIGEAVGWSLAAIFGGILMGIWGVRRARRERAP